MHRQRLTTFNLHVTDAEMGYDMIVGMDMVTTLVINILSSTKSIQWDSAEIPMRPRDSTLQDAYLIEDPEQVKQATKRITEILDAKYEKADLDKIVSNCLHLTIPQRVQLLSLLKTYESMFDGTLGVWQGDPYNIHLKDQTVPYHSKAFKLPK